MKKGSMLILLAAIVYAIGFSAVAIIVNGAESTNGVIATERVIDLPQDQYKWYLSVVGAKGEKQYETILEWFETNENLKELKDKVKFRQIENHTVIYKSRYAKNTLGLPMVRVQKHDGEVIYEEYGDSLPLSAGGLYGAIANDTAEAQGRRPFLPWRRKAPDKNCPDGRCPVGPKVTPPSPPDDPAPQPLDNTGPPKVAPTSGLSVGSAGLGAGAALLLLFGGCGTNLLVQWRRKRNT